jgi:predicted GIY-YIG superfamily endonuclease
MAIGRISQISHGSTLAPSEAMSMRFVYVLRNHETPPRYYTGLTSDVARRHAGHNACGCIHTAKYRPWSIDVVIEFADERRV